MQVEETPIGFEAPQKQRSTLATVSLVCSMIFCCPIVTIFGPLLGIIALLKLKKTPGIKGRGFAWSGIIIGCITTILSLVIITFIYNFAQSIMGKMAASTEEVFVAGFEGDYASVRTNLATSVTVSDEEIQLFIDELQNRYGAFDTVKLDMQTSESRLELETSDQVVPMTLIFEENAIPMEVLLRVAPNSGDPFDLQFRVECLRIFDSINGDIPFPNGSLCDTDNDVKPAELDSSDTNTEDQEPNQ